MDLHPTFAKLAGAQLPERKRDGQNIWPVWSPRNAKSPHDHFFYYHTTLSKPSAITAGSSYSVTRPSSTI